MALVRWSPSRDMMAIGDEMNRLFNQFFGRGEAPEGGWWTGSWMPAVDLYETDEALVLKAELPGFATEDIHLELKDNTLTLKGERKRELDVKEEQYHRVERAYGAFQRSFMLPALVDPDKAEASFKDGVLELRLRKAEEAKAKRIAITA